MCACFLYPKLFDALLIRQHAVQSASPVPPSPPVIVKAGELRLNRSWKRNRAKNDDSFPSTETFGQTVTYDMVAIRCRLDAAGSKAQAPCAVPMTDQQECG